ncbi:MAG TPA: hypothetical protein GXX49_03995 [Clostridiaceae bacterium]|nr:hypothetical protein [Clostridiaceae bacterium]
MVSISGGGDYLQLFRFRPTFFNETIDSATLSSHVRFYPMGTWSVSSVRTYTARLVLIAMFLLAFKSA